MSLDGTDALLAQNQADLSLLDLKDPGSPRLEGCFKPPGNVTDTAYSRGYAYLADSRQGLMVLDIRDASACKQVDSHSKFQGRLKRLSAWEDLLLADMTKQGLTILDISDPAQPRKILNLQEPLLVNDLLLAQDHAYIATSNGTLHVYNLQNPSQPLKMDTISMQCSPIDLGLSEDRLYMTSKEGQMHILDISTPEAPKMLASVNTGKCTVAGLAGSSIFLVDQTQKFRILDISDPSQPKRITQFKLPRHALALCIQDNTAYLHLTQNKLWILDLKNLTSGEHNVRILDLNTLASN